MKYFSVLFLSIFLLAGQTFAQKFPAALVGTWTTGKFSLFDDPVERPHGASSFKYVLTADGNFEFFGYMDWKSNDCTTAVFNDKRGQATIEGDRITFAPIKNHWKKTVSCTPDSNRELDYVLDKETYTWRTKTDDFGKDVLCLANEKGESCYRREEK